MLWWRPWDGVESFRKSSWKLLKKLLSRPWQRYVTRYIVVTLIEKSSLSRAEILYIYHWRWLKLLVSGVKQGQSVEVVTLSVSARWLIKHWNWTDVPRPSQQPGDPQVDKAEERSRLADPPPALTLTPSEAHQPLHISLCGGFHLPALPWYKPAFYVRPHTLFSHPAEIIYDSPYCPKSGSYSLSNTSNLAG